MLRLLIATSLAATLAWAAGTAGGCEDADPKCTEWAATGECATNAVWMMANCRKSCHSCQGGDRAWKLRTHIQTTYQNATDNKTKVVRVESVRINNVEIDERRQNVKVFGRFVLSWNDTMVSWDKEQWGLSWLNFYWIQIWTPNIVQINGGSTSNPGQVTSKVLAANYTGQIYLWSDFSFTTPFRFQYEDYPNDMQRVCYKFDDKRLMAVHFTVAEGVKNKEREATTDPFVSGWKIEDVEVVESPYTVEQLSDPRRNPFDVQADNGELCISLRRNAVYFTAEMLLPALITSLFTLAAVFFQLSKTQPILLGFSVVAQILSLILVSQRLPSFTAHTPTILKYAGFNMTWTAILFVISLVLERMATSQVDIPPPHGVSTFAGLVNKFLPIPKNSKHEDSTLQYAAFAHALNHVIFALSTVLYFIVILFSFVF
ncbi:ShKT domain-containing protein [Caenorhabditis elegans]|uniref:ShKT domain-containing protein n=1 Tax=Caenorhabditis elegans TaxID=6239 RepID=I2HA93_CAEEL|nr:ShKT domain-containing protein [Caenorhabditis elegans]CCH63800.1 ShKT domain-containing protein [Caenorhabditis elegans]|eukprot:NP_001255260.1 Ligand-Gated ion Channel [Caenorhabditis elegans]